MKVIIYHATLYIFYGESLMKYTGRCESGSIQGGASVAVTSVPTDASAIVAGARLTSGCAT